MTRPVENQQTVEAALDDQTYYRIVNAVTSRMDCDRGQRTIVDREGMRAEIEAALRDLVAQAEALRVEVDRQLGRHLCYTSDYSRERFWRDVDDALARLDGAR